MKNILKETGERLHRKCDSLSQAQRKKVLITLSVVYLLLTAIVITSVFMPDGNKQEKENFNGLIDNSLQRDSLVMPNLLDEDTEPLNNMDYE